MKNVPPKAKLQKFGKYALTVVVIIAFGWAAIKLAEQLSAGDAFIKAAGQNEINAWKEISSALDSPSWKTMDYLVEKAARDKAAGKGFGLNVVTEDATKVGTLGKGYSKARQSEAKLLHPENPALMRLFTPREHAALKGIDSQLISGLSNTVAHELLGQSVTPVPFQAIAKLVAASIHKVIQAGNKVFKLVKQVETPAKLTNQFVDEAKRFTLHTAQASLF